MKHEVHKIDATKTTLGRVASEAAKFLIGKHKPEYVPYKDQGDSVIIENYDKIKFSGGKMEKKVYYRPTTGVGAKKKKKLSDLWKRRPHEVLRRAVYGMLPKNSLRKEMIKRLKIEDGK
jgi:large subunit ribosomal protein L13